MTTTSATTNPIFTNEKSTRSLSEFDFIHDPTDKNSKLGIGSFASVKLAKEKKTGKQYAIKIICMHPSKVTSSDLHNIRTEITIHRKLDHPNIIKFHDYIQKDHNVYLILDYAEGGNLYSYIHKRKGLSSDEIFRFFYQTCLAVQYLHQNDVLHRDIKPENLLLDKNLNLKLCDFGWSTRRITEKRLTFCGTYEYMAPEIVHKKPYDYRVDIWSLGVLLYELIHREAPYKGRSLPEISKSLAKSHITFSSSTHPEAKDLILKILKVNPTERLSIAQILSHPWVQSHLSPEEDDSLQIEEFIVSPRELRPAAHMQSMHGESPKYNLRRDNENFKSEIITTTDDGTFADILSPKSRKNSHSHLFMSFNIPSSTKYNEKSKERGHDREKIREKTKHGNPTGGKTLNNSGIQRKSPLQDAVLNSQTKVVDENVLSARDYIRCSPTLPNKVSEKASLEEKIAKNNLDRKRKIFEANMLSPTFKTKVDNLLYKLSSHTTTHKSMERAPTMFSSKNQVSAQTPASEAPLGYRYVDENICYIPSSSGSSRAKAEVENNRAGGMMNQAKANFQKKMALPKGDNLSTLPSPVARTNLTTRPKGNGRGSEMFEDSNLVLPLKFSVAEGGKPLSTKNLTNVLAITDQNKYKGYDSVARDLSMRKLQKGYESKKKQGVKVGEEQSLNLHLSSSSDRRNENKENTKELIKEKENYSRFREEYIAKWEY